MTIITTLQNAVAQAVEQLYGEATDASKVQINTTPADFSGDYSVVIFPFVKISKKAPDQTAAEIGAYLQENIPVIRSQNVVKGFLNLTIADTYWQGFLESVVQNPSYGKQPKNGKKLMVEFSSPNTNKPLHLGHVRNILLGWSISQIFEAVGYEVVKTQIINDRGVAICKSMLAWSKFGEGKTPQSEGIKSDHFVGDWYVFFEGKLREEYPEWQETEVAKALFEGRNKTEQTEAEFFKDFKNKWFNEYSKLGAEVREMLLKWENNDPETIALWKKMNGWVYEGFDKTYGDLGVSFDKLYYESNTYLLGKDIVDLGLSKGVFYQKEDGSVWVDLTDIGLDHKVVLRSDGTSMYITQDLGTAQMRYHELGCERFVYVVADEQNYHFQVLFEILKRLGEPYAAGLHHLSYGMVELPKSMGGRMKTREGTVVDADDLMAEIISLANIQSKERGENDSIPPAEQAANMRIIGMGALKYFIIKVHAKKRMIFDPQESVDLQGQTGPYIQYGYARFNSILERAKKEGIGIASAVNYSQILPEEKDLLVMLHEFPYVIQASANEYDPSLLANYCYTLAKGYHKFYHELPIIKAEALEAREFRTKLTMAVGQVLKMGMGLLGIEMPARM